MQIGFCHLTPLNPTHTYTYMLTHSHSHTSLEVLPDLEPACLLFLLCPLLFSGFFPSSEGAPSHAPCTMGLPHTQVASLNFSSPLPPHWCDTPLTSQPAFSSSEGSPLELSQGQLCCSSSSCHPKPLTVYTHSIILHVFRFLFGVFPL